MPPAADGSSTMAYRFAANQAISMYPHVHISALVRVRKFSRNKDLRQSTDPKIAADLRPSSDGSAVRTSLVAGGG